MHTCCMLQGIHTCFTQQGSKYRVLLLLLRKTSSFTDARSVDIPLISSPVSIHHGAMLFHPAFQPPAVSCTLIQGCCLTWLKTDFTVRPFPLPLRHIFLRFLRVGKTPNIGVLYHKSWYESQGYTGERSRRVFQSNISCECARNWSPSCLHSSVELHFQGGYIEDAGGI